MQSLQSAALTRLRSATRLHQCVADADRLALVGKPPSLPAYLSYLARMYGFDAPLESALNVAPELTARIDLSKRMKANVIGMDLCDQGFPAADLLGLPHCALAPFQTLPEALGWLFVSEVNRSGHQLFRTYLARELPAVLQGASIAVTLTTAAEWRQLGALLDDVAASDACALDGVIEAAIHGFDCAHRWLRPGTPSGTHVRDAQRTAAEWCRQVGATGRRAPSSAGAAGRPLTARRVS